MFNVVSGDTQVKQFKDLADLQAGLTDGRLVEGDVVLGDESFTVEPQALALVPFTDNSGSDNSGDNSGASNTTNTFKGNATLREALARNKK